MVPMGTYKPAWPLQAPTLPLPRTDPGEETSS